LRDGHIGHLSGSKANVFNQLNRTPIGYGRQWQIFRIWKVFGWRLNEPENAQKPRAAIKNRIEIKQ
jgi:hypothetical protein